MLLARSRERAMRRHPVTLLRDARSMSTAAKPHWESFVAGGFPADTIEKLDAAIMALSDAMQERGHIRHVRTGATKGIKEQILIGREAVRPLDAIISRQFASDETLLAAWRSASRVNLPTGSTARSVAADTLAVTTGSS